MENGASNDGEWRKLDYGPEWFLSSDTIPSSAANTFNQAIL